jgi:hypothetical protein
MPAKSVRQQHFMGMVHAAQQGEGGFSPEVEQAAKSMSKESAADFAATKHSGLPEKKVRPAHAPKKGKTRKAHKGMRMADFRNGMQINEQT